MSSRQAAVARAGSPPPPPGIHDFRRREERPIRVVFDANVFFRREYLLPLAGSAMHGDLIVYWSTVTLREISKVVCRNAALKALSRKGGREASSLDVRKAIDGAAERLEQRARAVEAVFQYAVPGNVVTNESLASVPDPSDWVLIETALQNDAAILLTLDQRHLPHGAVIAGVECWHPDTFLTVFYQQNDDAYRRASRFVEEAGSMLRSSLL